MLTCGNGASGEEQRGTTTRATMTTMVPSPPIGGGTNKNATITTDIGAIYRYDNQPKLIGNDHEEEVWQERE